MESPILLLVLVMMVSKGSCFLEHAVMDMIIAVIVNTLYFHAARQLS